MMREEEIEKLKEYANSTRNNSCDMPTFETFQEKIKMAIALAPQLSSDGNVNYLFGKGIGVEIALRGNVQGRKKYNRNFPYRSHSDFEVYDAEGVGYTEEFRKVFGSQEFYPKTKTKGLSGMDETLMDRTYETVEYEGNKYLIPELEILFLDKYMRKEGTPREEGCDAVLLLKEYDLDIEKIKKYYEDYVKKQNLTNYENYYDAQVEALKTRALDNMEIFLEEDGYEVTLENKIKILRQKISETKSSRTPVGYAYGVRIDICPEPDKIKYIKKNGQTDLSPETKLEIRNLIKQAKIKEEMLYDGILDEIVTLHAETNQEKLEQKSEEVKKRKTAKDLARAVLNVPITNVETSEKYLRSIIAREEERASLGDN